MNIIAVLTIGAVIGFIFGVRMACIVFEERIEKGQAMYVGDKEYRATEVEK